MPAGALDPFIGAIFANALLNFGAIYYGVAERAPRPGHHLGPQAHRRSRVSRSMAYHPEIQHLLSEMTLELEAMKPHLDQIARGLVERASTTARPGR